MRTVQPSFRPADTARRRAAGRGALPACGAAELELDCGAGRRRAEQGVERAGLAERVGTVREGSLLAGDGAREAVPLRAVDVGALDLEWLDLAIAHDVELRLLAEP